MKRSFFEQSDSLKTFSQLFIEQKPDLFLSQGSVDEAGKNKTRYHSHNRELKRHITTKS